MAIRVLYVFYSDPAWIRTMDRRFRKPVLYPAELQDRLGCSIRVARLGDKNTFLLPIMASGGK
jgi:hypothetical protein